jgi:single-strand DNA-binding protein
MKNMAYTILDGNLTSDPETKKINNGKTITTFSMAINHYSKTSETDGNSSGDVSYIDVETWDKLADNCSEFLKKGKMVTVIGSLRQERWKSQDGTNRQKYKVIASSVRFDSFAENKKEKSTNKKVA